MPEKFHLNSVFPFSAKATTTTEYINPKGITDVSSVSCCERKWIYESNRMFSTKMKEIRNFSLEKLEIRNLHFDHFINDDEKRKKEINQGINYNVYISLFHSFSSTNWIYLFCWVLLALLLAQWIGRERSNHVCRMLNYRRANAERKLYTEHRDSTILFYYRSFTWFICMCAQSESSLLKAMRNAYGKPNSSLKNW